MDGTLKKTIVNRLRNLRNKEHKAAGDELTENNLLDYMKNAKVMSNSYLNDTNLYDYLIIDIYMQVILERKIQNSLQSICEETGMKEFCYRPKKDQKLLLRKWTRLSCVNQKSKFF